MTDYTRLPKERKGVAAKSLKAKFRYASWFEAGSELVRSWSPTSFEPDSVMEFGFEPVCDQLRTS